MWLFALLVALPLIEIGLFVTLGGAIGLWGTLAWVIGTGFAGVALIRAQGMRGLVDVRRETDLIRHPMGPLAHGALKVLAGILLILPGFLTDALGLLLLIPPLRSLLIAALAARIKTVGAGMPRREATAEVIEAEYTVITPEESEKPRSDAPSGWTRH
jgi:UPF0716 protein FxsA